MSRMPLPLGALDGVSGDLEGRLGLDFVATGRFATAAVVAFSEATIRSGLLDVTRIRIGSNPASLTCKSSAPVVGRGSDSGVVPSNAPS